MGTPQKKNKLAPESKRKSTRHAPQKCGGLVRPKAHSGKRLSKREWLQQIQCVRDELLSCKQDLADLKSRGKPTAPRGDQERVALEELERLRSEVSSLRRKCSEYELDAHANVKKLAQSLAEKQAAVTALAELNQRLQLDVEWLMGLRRDGMPPPASGISSLPSQRP